ncbi:hypothetical protein LPJ63_000074 [Coemansia sp. RSA 2711]|nr:hypothetical protein LPJ63_000074 [Coemansia sp. RSA 2711]
MTMYAVKAIADYSKAKPEELELRLKDVILVENDTDPSWWLGTNTETGHKGWFPSSFVRKDDEAKPKSKPKLKRRVRVVKRYEATDEDDLSLEVGDIVDVKKEVDGWYLGRHNGNIGMFPVSYAEEYSEDASAARPLPQPPVPLSRRGTAGPEATLPQPPSLPARTPALPPRASTETTLTPAAGEKAFAALTSPLSEEDPEGSKKDKKAGRRISRLFGSKKHKHKDGADAGRADDHAEPAFEEEPIEGSASPSKPLPQPTIASPPPPPPAMTSPPPPGVMSPPPPRVAPPAPPTAPGKPPPVPAAAPPVPAAAPPVPAPSAAMPSVPAPPARRPSADDEAKDHSSPAGTRPQTAGSDDEAEVEARVEESTPKPRVQAKLAKVLDDYEAQSPEELNLMKDDVVTIISRGSDDEPRWKGEYHGKKGYFPGTMVEPIEESAALDDEEGEDSGRPKGGFRLAAYGVQQGGLGSIFAGGGMPALRKSAPRKNSEAEPAEAVSPAPAPAPAIPKLRSVPRPPKDTTPKEEEPQPNFLAQLNRVPRKQVPSASEEESTSASPRSIAAPVVPISRKSTMSNEPEAESESREESAGSGFKAETSKSPELPSVPEASMSPSDATVPQDADVRPQTSSSKSGDDEFADAEVAQPEGAPVEAPSVEEQADDTKVKAAYDPVRSPALPQVKRLVRRGPRQMPTAEGLKKCSGESQSQSLSSALRSDKDVEPEPEPEAARPAPPSAAEKPKGSRFGAFGGPQLPTGGFKASGRVGSAMASRLAALQARATGGGEEDEEPARGIPARSTPPEITSPPPPPVSKKPSFSPRAAAEPHVAPVPLSAATPTAASAAVPAEWQKKIEDEQSQLRSEVDRARKGSEQVEQLAARLATSERENQAHKQTISGLEQQVEALVSQLAALKSDISGIQRSVAGLESNKGVSASEVTTILRGELQGALDPLHKQNQELQDGSKKLDKKIDDLRTYVDELVVEEEEE